MWISCAQTNRRKKEGERGGELRWGVGTISIKKSKSRTKE